ncbi:MAG: AbrB/MazE/SpoVT family DNA-binding domain-containing protein, partial [Gammaproteobacteria bacterium]
MPEVSVTSKGQVTIPKRIRDELGIAAGSKLDFELAGGGARMRLVGKPARSRIEDGPSILEYSGPRIPVGDLQG